MGLYMTPKSGVKGICRQSMAALRRYAPWLFSCVAALPN